MKIAVYNNKGGVGKTSLVAHVAFRAMEKKQKLLVLDADQQGNCIDWLTRGQWNGDVTVQLTPYVKATADIMELRAAHDNDLVIVDCPPAFHVVENYTDVDVWIVPVSGRFSVQGSMNAIEAIKQVEKRPRIVLVGNMVDAGKSIGRAQLAEIKKLGVELFKLLIPRADVVSKAEMLTMPVWKVPYGMRSSAAQNLLAFSEWVLSGCTERGVYE